MSIKQILDEPCNNMLKTQSLLNINSLFAKKKRRNKNPYSSTYFLSTKCYFSVLLVHIASCKYVIYVERFVNTVRYMYIYVAKSIVICLYANKLFV